MSDVPLLAVIEDDDAVREAMSELLGVLGYCTRLYSSAEQFLMARDRQAFACIITDLRLPGLDGLQLHSEMLARGDAVPFILVTSYITRPVAARALQAGVRAILLKPISAAAIIRELTAILGDGNEAGVQCDATGARGGEIPP
ncbi:response regulator transcription factor [Ancylobacter amanitiformis]|uniref:FixJ family two-component response regulator n=1 Tax=Ancylobacter amanitiformis TaxID=217069 RepID=A0ABU0LUX9_9HYPH|nr:response regulator [Ancylobacter amanitiformis]MDQ0512474.1 FixJ family two-component response regulator [Ancylobacter amanitiformis]